MTTPINALLPEPIDVPRLEPEDDSRPGSGYMLRDVEKYATSAPRILLNRLRRTEFPEQIYMSRAAKNTQAIEKGRVKR